MLSVEQGWFGEETPLILSPTEGRLILSYPREEPCLESQRLENWVIIAVECSRIEKG